ncbi:MAG: hypothetical protein ACXWF5_03055 [Actinomycetota bacterium]
MVSLSLTAARASASTDTDTDPASLASAASEPRGLAGALLQAWLAFALYLIVSLLVFGLPIAGRLASSFVGQGSADAQLYVWDLAWWPHAIAHGLNPFHPTLVWFPHGVNMAWVTGVPGPALVMTPISMLAGPVVSSNVLALLAPALAGWAAYLLCREVTERWWPSVAGGWLFAFTTYMNGQMRGHMNLFLVFPVPLAAYLVVRYGHGRLSGRSFVFLLTATLVMEFSISTEVFASMTMFGAVALAGAYAFAPGAREALRRIVPRVSGAYLLAMVPLAPYLWFAAIGARAAPLRPVGGSAVDLLSFVIPRPDMLLGGSTFASVTVAFRANLSEDGGYLGIAMLVVVALAVIARRGERTTWLLAGFCVFAAILALGGYLEILGHRTIPMPWLLPAHLPILGNALPERFTMYLWLGAAVVVARWLAHPVRRRWEAAARYGAVALAVITLLPDARMPDMHQPATVPRLFADARLRSALSREGTILILHDRAHTGSEMLWQAEADFTFAMPQGHLGPQPSIFAGDPTSAEIAQGQLYGTTSDELRTWLHAHGVRAIAITPGALDKWRWILDEVSGARPRLVGGMWIYGPPSGASTF